MNNNGVITLKLSVPAEFYQCTLVRSNEATRSFCLVLLVFACTSFILHFVKHKDKASKIEANWQIIELFFFSACKLKLVTGSEISPALSNELNELG